jgi:hypothetical protein
VVLQNIFNQIESGASQICLALTSKTLLASSHPFSFAKTRTCYDNFGTQGSTSSPETDYPLELRINGKIVDSWLRPISHLCLMAQLRDWMPKHLRFCWHCLYWLPGFIFPDSEYLELHELPRLCMDCIPGHQTDRGQTLRNCDGCVARDKVADVKYTEQGEAGEEDEEWDFLAKLANRDSSGHSTSRLSALQACPRSRLLLPAAKHTEHRRPTLSVNQALNLREYHPP